MLARQITLPDPLDPPNSFLRTRLHALDLSCHSFCSPFRLFSIACSLFSQNTRGRGTRRSRFPRATSHQSRPCLPLLALRIKLTPFLSHCSKLFVLAKKAIPFVINKIHTLSAKYPGWGQAHDPHFLPSSQVFTSHRSRVTSHKSRVPPRSLRPPRRECSTRTSRSRWRNLRPRWKTLRRWPRLALPGWRCPSLC